MSVLTLVHEILIRNKPLVLCKSRFVKNSGKSTARGDCWMNYGSALNAVISLIFLTFSLSGYETSGSGLGDAARWESRHLLQEAFTTEIQVYIEPEKNCTDPGKMRSAVEQSASSMKPHQVFFTVNTLYLPACCEGPEWFGCQPSIVVMSCVRFLDFKGRHKWDLISD